MEISAKLKKLRISAKKVKPIIDLIRGMNTQQALRKLDNMVNRAALPIAKLVRSVEANYKQKSGSEDPQDLYISKIYAGPGGKLKRIQAGPKGMARPIEKKYSHVFVFVKKQPAKN